MEKLTRLLDFLDSLEESSNQPKIDSPYEVGKNYLIRTVTMTQTGKLLAIYPQELVLIQAAWVASTGRFHNALIDESFEEVEPFINPVIIGRSAIVDCTEISNLPKEQR